MTTNPELRARVLVIREAFTAIATESDPLTLSNMAVEHDEHVVRAAAVNELSLRLAHLTGRTKSTGRRDGDGMLVAPDALQFAPFLTAHIAVGVTVSDG